MKTIGERIRELRGDKDLSLRELAARIGVSAAFLSDVELSRRYPSDKHLEKLALVLETPLEELQRFDTRPPVQEFRKLANADPAYGFAFRRMIDERISSREILDFIEQRNEQPRRNKGKDTR